MAYKKLSDEEQKEKNNADNILAAEQAMLAAQEEGAAKTQKVNEQKAIGEIVDPEFTRAKSMTHNNVKFALGEKGEFKGHAYPAAFKIRTKEVRFDKEFNNYKVNIPYLTLAAFLTWLKKGENMAFFSAQVRLEKDLVLGISDSF
jgi:hypothetical protein